MTRGALRDRKTRKLCTYITASFWGGANFGRFNPFLGIFTLFQAFSIIHGVFRYLSGVLRVYLVLIFLSQKVVGATIYAFSMSGGAARKRHTRTGVFVICVDIQKDVWGFKKAT